MSGRIEFLAAYRRDADGDDGAPQMVEVERDGVTYAVRIHPPVDAGHARGIAIATVPLDGFELRVRAGTGAPVVDSNDDGRIDIWVTAAARHAVLRSLAGAEGEPDGAVNLHAAYGLTPEVIVVPGNRGDRTVLAALDACVLLAGVTEELARELGDALRDVPGATPGKRWVLGEDFAVIERAGWQVALRYARAWSETRDRDPSLHTSARVRRASADGEAWAMWRRDAPLGRPAVSRDLRAALAGAPRVEERYDIVATDGARSLERLAQVEDAALTALPAALAAGAETITLWWYGMMTDAARIGAAADLLAALAVDETRADGPYR